MVRIERKGEKVKSFVSHHVMLVDSEVSQKKKK